MFSAEVESVGSGVPMGAFQIAPVPATRTFPELGKAIVFFLSGTTNNPHGEGLGNCVLTV